ncbi:MAG: SUMF1/EgtB/PvdO family nonheme iron enzyme, partial [Saprospiraceae bacterium]|nr:SUMF1/EgtB/PvdO family nonheme iron enzyme [Saprospiraceae bacterium]
GNVWEWCWDWGADYPDEPKTNYEGAPSGSTRVLRGGSWYSDDNYYRVAVRDDDYPYLRNYYFGFRVVRHL